MNELAASQPVLLQDLKPTYQPIVMQYPNAVSPFLRFQVLIPHRRASFKPIFEGKHMVGHELDGLGEYHRLIGFGSTIEAAQAMAKGAK